MLLYSEVERKIGNVFEAFAVDHDVEKFFCVVIVRVGDGLEKFVEGEVIDAVDVSCSESQRCDSAGQRFSGYDGDVRQATFAVADEIQRL